MPAKYIDILEDEIIKGKWADSAECPIALALKREFKAPFVFVDQDDIEIYKDDGSVLRKYKTTKEIREFIERFDAKEPVTPCKLRLA